MSVGRVFAIPLVAALAYYKYDLGATIAFAVAGLSDYVDGWIARRYGYESKLGMLLDPLADKIIVVSVMVTLLFLGRLEMQIQGIDSHWIALTLVIVTVGREIGITGLRSIASSNGIEMPADRWGKLKTWIQFFALVFLLYNQEPVLLIGKFLLVFSVAAALWSGIHYCFWFVKKLPD